MKTEKILEVIKQNISERTDVTEALKVYDKVFGSFFYTAAGYFLNETEKRFSNNDGKVLLKNYHDIIMNNLVMFVNDALQTAVSILIIELYERKEKGIYPSEDIYYDFCNDMRNFETIKELTVKYPELFSLIFESAERRAELISSCAENIFRNKETIEKTFDISFSYIDEISVSSGDSHNNGKKVIIIKTDTAAFVYKPHSLAPEKLFEKIIGLISDNSDVKYDLRSAAACSFPDFGVQEFIFQKPVGSEEEAARYFYRIGAFGAVFDSLTCDDLHYENIICSGEYPYFVDLETLIKNTAGKEELTITNGFFAQTLNELSDSVLGTMLFPLNTTLSFFDMDLAGISGSSHETSQKWKSYDLINEGTDKIRFVTKEGKVSEANNLLICNGKEVNPIYFTEEIISGYRDAIKAIMMSAEEILREIRESNIMIRRVLRPTAFYAKFLKASYSPKYMASSDERRRLFYKLYKNFEDNEKEIKRIGYEIDALMRNDIPLFQQKITSGDLIADNVTAVGDYNNASPYDSVVKQFAKTDDSYIRKQISYIRMSLSTNYRSDDTRENFGRCFPCEKIMLDSDPVKAAEIIADRLCDTAIKSADGKSLAWFTECSGDQYMLEPADTKLYEGGGNLLFLLCLWKCTKKEKWLGIAEKALNGLEELGYVKNISDISLFVGSAGMLYIYYFFYAYTGNGIYLEKLEKLSCDILAKLPELSIESDVIRGASGAVTALVRINRNVHIKAIDGIVSFLSGRLAEMIEKDDFPVMTGFAHGYAGASLALAEYGSYSGDDHYIRLAEKVVEKENSYFCEEAGNWRDLRGEGVFGSYWCHGAPGIGLSRLMIKDIISISVERDIEQSKKCILKNGFSEDKDHSLCHGVFGSIDMLITYGRILDEPELTASAEKNAEKFISEIEKTGFRSGLAAMPAIPSFMTGITGTGYELLRIHDHSIPSVNAIEVPVLRRDKN